MSDIIDVLAPYRKKGDNPASRTEAVTTVTRQPYRPYELSTGERRYLEFRFRFPRPSECLINSMLLSIQPEWRFGQGITLEYAKPMVVDINGDNLIELYQHIKQWKVEWLTEFDPFLHELPTDKSAPFIKSIEIHTHRPETIQALDIN